jgi:uncharacterized tellurite resistance protein B-like protein
MPAFVVVALTLVFWVAYWFIRMGGIDHYRAKAAQRRETARLAEARQSERLAPLRAVDDSRDAAAVLMLLAARAAGDPTREQIAVIENILRSVFGFKEELTGRMAQARFTAARADSFEQAAGLFSDLLMKQLSPDERSQLIDMVEEVSAVEGPSPAQSEAVAVLKRRIGFAAAH